MVITLTPATSRAYEFACHSAACRPPGSGGTGGSTKSGSGGAGARAGSTPLILKEQPLAAGIVAAWKRSAGSTKDGGVTPQQARQTVMNDLNKISAARTAARARAVTHTAPTGTPYRNSGSLGDQVARGQHLAKNAPKPTLKETLDRQWRQTIAMIAKEKKARAELLKKAKKFAAGNDVEGLL